MSRSATYYIEQLDMSRHPEGGYYKETFASEKRLSGSALEADQSGTRALWTSIVFLLETGEVSHFHRLKSDEMWYFHDGSPLSIYMITPEGELVVEQLGLDLQKGEKPQVLVPKGTIFGSAMNASGFSLVGCMVAPGFDFVDFELFDAATLLKAYPAHEAIIKQLT